MKKLLFIAILFSLSCTIEQECPSYIMEDSYGIITDVNSDEYLTIATVKYTTTSNTYGYFITPIKSTFRMLVPNTYQVGDTIRFMNTRVDEKEED